MRIIRTLVLAMLATLSLSFAVFAQDEAPSTVNLGGSWGDFGLYLTNADGMTLYTFTNDEGGVSACYDQCATNWPALTVAEGEWPSLAAGISGRLGVTVRTDGSRQVTYNNWPLYTFINDTAPGDVLGHTAGDVWFVAAPPTVGLRGNADLGRFLVDERGLTLYTFSNDTDGTSSCYDQCATSWPALTVPSEESLRWQPGIVGEFGVTERTDGTLQVTFNGQPLYFWQDDAAAGDALGQGLGDVWFVARVDTVSVRENEELGNVLVGPNGMTLYTFTNDEAGVSNCADQCLANWPALTVVEGEELSLGEGVTGELATIERPDGALQVTLDGAPLYYWLNDVTHLDTLGQGLGDAWFVAQPAE